MNHTVQCRSFYVCACTGSLLAPGTLIKKKIKFSSYMRKFRMEQLQSHIWLTASSYMGKYFRISSNIRKPFLICDFATAPLWISLYMRKILFYFYQCTINQMISINLGCLFISDYFQDGKVGHVFVSNFCRPQVQAVQLNISSFSPFDWSTSTGSVRSVPVIKRPPRSVSGPDPYYFLKKFWNIYESGTLS